MDQPFLPDDTRPFALLDELAILAANVWDDPNDFAFVSRAIAPCHQHAVLRDAPRMRYGKICGPADLRYGPRFGALIDDLLGRRFARLIERKFGVDLSAYSPAIMMPADGAGRQDEGYLHPDAKHKIIAVLLGFSRERRHQRGGLRVLRGDGREDFAFEFAPAFGHMLIFRVGKHCWHGLLPHSGRGTALHLCYVDSERFARREYWRQSMSPFAKPVPIMRHAIEWAPA